MRATNEFVVVMQARALLEATGAPAAIRNAAFESIRRDYLARDNPNPLKTLVSALSDFLDAAPKDTNVDPAPRSAAAAPAQNSRNAPPAARRTPRKA